MPTPPLSDDLAREAWDAYTQHGTAKEAADALGINRNTFDNRLKVARVRGYHLSEGAAGIISAARLAAPEAKGGWVHTYDDDGKKIGATRWAPQTIESDPQELIDAIIAGLSEVPVAEPVPVPEAVADDLCNVWPMFDVHFGMHAWGRETLGPDYDLKLARDDLLTAVDNLSSVVPRAKMALLILGGDTLHIDDSRSETPASRHKLDSDGRYLKVVIEAIAAIKATIYRLLQTHERVVVRVMRGNHDEHSHIPLMVGLKEHFAESRVEVLVQAPDLFTYQWGKCGIFAHHGDRMKPTDFVLKLADVCDFWSAVKHRHAYTGHMHQMAAQRIGGVVWERLEPFAPADGYGASWVNRRGLKVDTYHTQKGRVASAYDPLERG
jgi:hypothetical protein